MIYNYFTIAFRHLWRRKLYSSINIIGLAIGLTCFILTYTYVHYELQYDKHHPQADQIYRILRETKSPQSNATFRPEVSGALADAIKRDVPDVQHVIRVFTHYVGFQYQNHIKNGTFCLIDPEFFDVFHFPLLNGDPKSALKNPGSILLTKRAATKFFGTENPIGKIVSVADDLMHGDYQITGILEDVPKNATLQFDFVTTHMPTPHFARLQWEDWLPGSWRNTWLFLVIPKPVSVQETEQKLQNLMTQYMGSEVSENNRYHLQPLTRIHLYSNLDYGMQSKPDIYQILVIAGIAILVLLIACINFINLATAKSTERRKEVGIRKVVGAHRIQLIRQFLTESILLSSIALLFAILFTNIALPMFNNFIGVDLNLTWQQLPVLLGLILVVGICAGSYPAFFLSASQPIEALNRFSSVPQTGSFLRKGLVTFQFAVSILMIMSTTVVYHQLHYMGNQNLGHDKDHIVEIWIFGRNGALRKISDQVKKRFLQYPGILRATVTSNPGAFGLRPRKAIARIEGFDQEKTINQFGADEDFLDLYNFKIINGRNLRQEAQNEFLINETAAQQLGWTNPIGKQIQLIDQKRTGTVVGVVKDFHYQSLHEKVKPLIITKLALPHNLIMKISPTNVSTTLNFIESQWKELVPGVPFSYGFYDERINKFYQEDQQVGQLILTSSLLAILIACLGLFGLASFVTEKRTKEIGIRKILGASVSNIFVLLTSGFIKLVILSGLFALPIAYYTMNAWLQNFAYRITLDLTLLFLDIFVALAIALLTIGYHTLIAARTNPIASLRNE